MREDLQEAAPDHRKNRFLHALAHSAAEVQTAERGYTSKPR